MFVIKSSSNLLQDYLSNRWQKVMQGPFLFNIFICGIFLILKTVYFTGYVDDNTSLVVSDNIKDVIPSLEEFGEDRFT